MKNIKKEALDAHKKAGGKIELVSRVPLRGRRDMSIYYTPGVAEVSRAIARQKSLGKIYNRSRKIVAVVSDGSAVLGLGNIGPEAAMPVMEGKAILFKKFAGVDAFPIVLNTQDVEEIVATVKAIAPSFGGINLEDISAPRCFEIEERLKKELDIPVFHDDQHGTAIVCLAGLINALKVVGKKITDCKIVISGAGAAGVAVAKLLKSYGAKNIILVDSKGSIYAGRSELNEIKKELAKHSNPRKEKGSLADVIGDADIFIGVSKPNILKKNMVQKMAKDAIVFAMSNPDPEILPAEAKKGGAKVVATGRSDFPNQVNNVLVFPGIFKGAIKSGAKEITERMKIAAAEAIASLIKKPSAAKVIPAVFDKRVADVVAKAVEKAVK